MSAPQLSGRRARDGRWPGPATPGAEGFHDRSPPFAVTSHRKPIPASRAASAANRVGLLAGFPPSAEAWSQPPSAAGQLLIFHSPVDVRHQVKRRSRAGVCPAVTISCFSRWQSMPPDRNTRSIVEVPELFVCGLLHAAERPTSAGSAALSLAILANRSRLSSAESPGLLEPRNRVNWACAVVARAAQSTIAAAKQRGR